ncbi:nuclear transport factor 2 family protein [Streptomyces sp. NPDC017056]|uniref:nuclear transport factor 2 family protein n=1 Tax=Streptomyces sp. NPDC017056 TaxID=3364973 RepID=UPI0037A03D29
MPALSPLDVLEQRRAAVTGQDADAFADLFAPDGVIELPFAGTDVPDRIEGRETIRTFARAAMAAMRVDSLVTLAVHRTEDPEVVIAETLAKGSSGRGDAFEGRSVQLFRIRDGRILLFRDYTGPLREPS